MTVSNSQRVGDALAVLSRGLAPFVERELKSAYGDDWAPTVVDLLDMDGYKVKKVSLDDVQFQLKVMWKLWQPVFGKVLGQSERTLVSELMTARNAWAHQEAFSTDDAYRVLDTVQRLLTAVSAEEADLLEDTKQDLLRIRFEEASRRKSRQTAQALFAAPTPAGLTPWREVVQPHSDVQSGRYDQAEFAADLHQVYSGQGMPEYSDPVEFFRRTYLTEGLQQLLEQALRRLSGTGGVPIVDLQTNFGGGKTHSLLALYHLFGGTPASELAGVHEILRAAEVGEAPAAHRAVLVGTKIAPGQVHRKLDGTEVHTLWGELAWQLGGSEGYALVADADRTATNPGAALDELFARYSPCLVLIDEWVAYARQLWGKDSLPAGTFDTHFTFAQALTEAAKAVPRTLVVISIPASAPAQAGGSAGEPLAADVEVGGEGGKAALDRLRNVIGRMESPWRPASAEESFEIVRRRLFEPLSAEGARQRDAVAKVFREFYKSQQKEFPQGCGESAYERRIKAAYPIHPELFDRLYNDWSALPRFQRTRGVLRLMAGVIHELWEGGDQGPLILPCSVPLDEPLVASELTRYLEDAWKPIIDTDVDGPEALPVKLDQENPNFGKLRACRRVARTVFLGSAPTVRSPNKGIDMRGIKLGSVLPGESPAVFGDALRRMTEHATHLYVDAGRYWFDTQTSITQLAKDRAAEYSEDDVHVELLKHVRGQCKKRGEFAAVHVAPASSADVPDEDVVRLVVLGPQYPHSAKAGDETRARTAAAELLESRGPSPRRYRNMLVFLAPDMARLEELDAAVRQYLAWDSIDRDKETLNLSAFFMRQAEERRQAALDAIRQRVPETYIWLLAPEQKVEEAAGSATIGPLTWSATRANGAGELAERVSAKMVREELLIPKYSGVLLRRELDRIPLWPPEKEHINTRQLWEYFAQYLYLPRLRDAQVLAEAIRDGVSSLTWRTETFAYAAAVDEKGEWYQGLCAGQADASIVIDSSSVVVKPEAAARQIEADRAAEEQFAPKDQIFTPSGAQPPLGEDGRVWQGGEGVAALGDRPGMTSAPAAEKAARRFYGKVALEAERLNKQVPEIVELVVQPLTGLAGADVKVTLEIEADVPDGVPHKTVIDV
ncbi:MAG TPA: Swt1 family HEPN domain-containing protein, partial [Thermoleophilia bacterium]|nr:Swt1 family HEPN domain-containing protein [Thermoleophilia bacterium]